MLLPGSVLESTFTLTTPAMSRIHRSLISAATIVGSLSLATPLIAQAPGEGTVLHVSPYVGYMVFGDFIKGPLGTSVSNAPAPIYGAQVGLSLAPSLSLIGNVGYTQSDIKVGVPILGGLSVGHSSMLLYDGGLEYNLGSLPMGGMPISPFVQAGVGAIRYTIDESILTSQSTSLVGNAGVGADLSVGRVWRSECSRKTTSGNSTSKKQPDSTSRAQLRTTGRSAPDCDSISDAPIVGWGWGHDTGALLSRMLPCRVSIRGASSFRSTTLTFPNGDQEEIDVDKAARA
jgi:hypothetical protein